MANLSKQLFDKKIAGAAKEARFALNIPFMVAFALILFIPGFTNTYGNELGVALWAGILLFTFLYIWVAVKIVNSFTNKSGF